ncbi:hypothetical protein ACTHQ4_16440 [Alkalicoccobacillus gibsonii]|uniref:hypothetical protein n=1 Tax=Alkalicoccobacillus gibsonii TaxID=79881 RepID=UPI003F7B9D5D
MVKSKITCKLFKLTNVKSLQNVQDIILKRRYADPLITGLTDKKKTEKMSEYEKNFFFTWGEKSKPNNIKLNNIDGIERSVDYLFVTAEIEFTKRTRKDSRGEFLPKKDRINYIQITNYFFCIGESVYLIICSSIEKHIERVKNLVGMENLTNVDDSYKIPSDLFNWMFFIYTQNKGKLDDSIKLMNIGGFIGNTGDEHNIFKGTSDQTSELIITKAFISNGETLKTITARLKNDDIDIIFSIDDYSNTHIFVKQSMKRKLFEAEDVTPFLIIYLYSYLIPKIKSLYNISAKQFLDKEKKQFSIKIGLEVIESIINHNYLSFDEVAALFIEQKGAKRSIRVK